MQAVVASLAGVLMAVFSAVPLASPDTMWYKKGDVEYNTRRYHDIRSDTTADASCDLEGVQNVDVCERALANMWVASILALVAAPVLMGHGTLVLLDKPKMAGALQVAAAVLLVATFISGSICIHEFNSEHDSADGEHLAFYHLFWLGTILVPVLWLVFAAVNAVGMGSI